MTADHPTAPSRHLPRLTVFRIAVMGLFWLAMTVWLIRFEACPGSFTGRLGGYRDMLKGGVQIRSSWMKIIANGTPVGYAHTEIDVDERSSTAHYLIDSEMELELNILALPQKIYTRLNVKLDILSRLQEFAFTVRSSKYGTEITGQRTQGDRFVIIIQTGEPKPARS